MFTNFAITADESLRQRIWVGMAKQLLYIINKEDIPIAKTSAFIV